MFNELLQTETWRRRLEAAGFRVVLDSTRDDAPNRAPGTARPNPSRDRAAPP